MPGSDAPAPPARPPIYRRHQLAGVAVAAVAVGLLSLMVDSAFGYGLLHSWLVFSILGLGFYLVFGVSGQFAFSQGAFFGLGAYASVWASDGRSFLWGLAGAVAVTALIALAFALVVVRSDHFYFAIAMLAFSFIATVVFREFEAFTAPGGEIVGIPKPDLFGHTFDTGRSLALFLGGFLALALLLTAFIERSPLEREAIAFRDNRQVAATVGVPVLRLRLGMFVLGSTYAGVAGPVRPQVGVHQPRVLLPRARHRHLPHPAARRHRLELAHRAYVLVQGRIVMAGGAAELGDRDAMMASYLGQSHIDGERDEGART
ncbi:MAG TPA: hypothetical protein VHK25_14820 [Acidimicrobiales bacterium]|nr:hypothetical protein [Acidimicrobiales bacterium]